VNARFKGFKMNVLSLFDGISAGQVALQRAGIKVEKYYASEIDKYAIQVTQKNFPDTIQLGDITKLDGTPFEGKIDLIIGGSPCQSFSVAGKQGGFEGKSGLFWEYVRLLKEVNPKYFLLENVKMKKEWRDVISEALSVEPIKINSSLLSAQQRHRLYWTNIPDVSQPEDKNILLKDILEQGTVDRDKSYCIDANYWKGTNVDQYLKKKRRQIVYTENGFRKLSPTEVESLQTFQAGYTEGISNTQRYKALGNSWTVDVIAHILSFLKDNPT